MTGDEPRYDPLGDQVSAAGYKENLKMLLAQIMGIRAALDKLGIGPGPSVPEIS